MLKPYCRHKKIYYLFGNLEKSLKPVHIYHQLYLTDLFFYCDDSLLSEKLISV
jgi:hypothetical protein